MPSDEDIGRARGWTVRWPLSLSGRVEWTCDEVGNATLSGSVAGTFVLQGGSGRGWPGERAAGLAS